MIAMWHNKLLLVSFVQTMTDENSSHDSKQVLPDLSGLADFQFGPAWARPHAKKEHSQSYQGKEPRDRGPRKPRRFAQGNRERFDRKDREGSDADTQGGFRRRDNRNRPSNNNRRFRNREDNRQPIPQAEPIEGLKIEIRPVDSGLVTIQAEVQKHHRTISLMDLAKVVMGGKERYDVVFIKQENGPTLFREKQSNLSCYLTKEDAMRGFWSSALLDTYYESIVEEVEAPKGEFKAIAVCKIGGELIGPANWHGYQAALMNLHRTKYGNMPVEVFRTKISSDSSEETVQAWVDSMSKRTIWKARRADAEAILPTTKAVEQDFIDKHFDDVFQICEKVFVNGTAEETQLSPALWALFQQASVTTQRHPSMLIPNLCHGLARHRLPIFKWKNGHYTGPSRPRSLNNGIVLSDRLMSIAIWAKENPGKGVDMLLKKLTVEPTEENLTDEEKQAKIETQHQEIVRDLIWLSEQGYILVFTNNTIHLAKDLNLAEVNQTPVAESVEAPVEQTEPEVQASVESTEAGAAEEEKEETEQI